MKNTSWLAAAVAAGAIGAFAPTAATAHAAAERVTPALQQAIPNIPGKSLGAVVVDYPPGGASPAHEHAKSAFIYGYVVSGAIESQVNDGPRQVLRAGESFYEPPGAKTSRQPQREQDPAREAARRVCGGHRRHRAHNPHAMTPSRSSGTRP